MIMNKIKRRDFMKLAGMAVFAPKILMANNNAFITLLDIELPKDKHLLYKSMNNPSIRINSIKFNDRPLSDFEGVLIYDRHFGKE